MAKKIKDTDYLAISARVKAMETTLLTWERMMQILDARSEAEALKLVQESGYPTLTATDPEALDQVLSRAREEMLSDLMAGVPDPRYIELFKIKYDYHNVKAILKAAAMGTDPERMLMDMGRVSSASVRLPFSFWFASATVSAPMRFFTSSEKITLPVPSGAASASKAASVSAYS